MALCPAIHCQQRTHHQGCQEHVHTAGHARAVHFEVGQRDARREQCQRDAAAPRIEGIDPQRHEAQSQGRGQARGEFVDTARKGADARNEPVEKGRFEGNLVAIVDGENPVAMLNH